MKTNRRRNPHPLRTALQIMVMLLIFHACGFALTEISVPGTGRGVAVNSNDPNWSIYGYWNAATSITLSGSPVRNATDDMLCINNGDHTIKYSEDPPEDPVNGGTVQGNATIYFYYPFQIVEQGDYSLSCYVSGAEEVSIAKYVGASNGGDFQGYLNVVADNSTHVGCQLYTLSHSLDPGLYIVRVKRQMTGLGAKITVNSAGGGYPNMCIPAVEMTSTSTRTIKSGESIGITFTSTVSANYSWTTSGNPNTDVSAGSQNNVTSLNRTITNNTSETQVVTYMVTPRSVTGNCAGPSQIITIYVTAPCSNGCDTIQCSDCIGSFAPEPGKKYVISAWVQEANSSLEMNYTGPAIGLTFTGGASLGPFKAKGEIIDGWQRIDTTFTVPSNASAVFVRLINTGSNEVYFDDLRIHPLKASLKSFVYDPISMRLMAELDENNYATFYEYDEEGKLIRVKKETERGVKTIKETVSSIRKKP